MPTIRIGGREIPLYYSTYEMIQMQQDIGCTAFQLNEEVFGINRADEDDDTNIRFGVLTDAGKLKKLGTLIRILGNAGLEEAGQKPDLTDKWVLRNIRPAMIMAYTIAITSVINEAMRMETGQQQEGPVDEGLEEENRKKEQESLPTGESSPAD